MGEQRVEQRVREHCVGKQRVRENGERGAAEREIVESGRTEKAGEWREWENRESGRTERAGEWRERENGESGRMESAGERRERENGESGRTRRAETEQLIRFPYSDVIVIISSVILNWHKTVYGRVCGRCMGGGYQHPYVPCFSWTSTLITPRAHARARGYVIGRGVYYILYIYILLPRARMREQGVM